MPLPVTAALTPQQIDVVKAMVFASSPELGSRVVPSAGRFDGVDHMVPRYDPAQWANMLQLSSRLSRAVRVMARNTVGLGLDVVPVRPEERMSRRAQVLFERERDRLERLLDMPNAEQSMPEVLECYKIDEEATGTGYLEAVRDAFGVVAALYHAPSVSMRVSDRVAAGGRPMFIQRRSSTSDPRWFAPFGERTAYDPVTGRPAAASSAGARASEIIRSRIYTPDDDHYGAPRFVPAAPAIMSTRLGQQWNINFLRNSAHLPYAVIVEDGNLDKTSLDMVQTFIEREGKGVENAGRILLLQPDLKDQVPGVRSNTRIRLEKIAVGLTDDGSFLKLREADNEDVREVLGLAKILLGTFTDANRSNAVIALRITVQQEIEPEIVRKEHMLNSTIVRDMGMRLAKIRLRRPKVLDALQEASLTQKLLGALSMNELRAAASRLLGVHLEPMAGRMADIPRGFFQDARLLMQAEELESKIVERLAAILGQAGPVDGNADSREADPAGLLPAEFDNVVSLMKE